MRHLQRSVPLGCVTVEKKSHGCPGQFVESWNLLEVDSELESDIAKESGWNVHWSSLQVVIVVEWWLLNDCCCYYRVVVVVTVE